MPCCKISLHGDATNHATNIELNKSASEEVVVLIGDFFDVARRVMHFLCQPLITDAVHQFPFQNQTVQFVVDVEVDGVDDLRVC